MFYAPPFEEWWEGHIVLPLSVRPFLSVSGAGSGVSNMRLKFFRRGHPCPLDTFLVSRYFLSLRKDNSVLATPLVNSRKY